MQVAHKSFYDLFSCQHFPSATFLLSSPVLLKWGLSQTLKAVLFLTMVHFFLHCLAFEGFLYPPSSPRLPHLTFWHLAMFMHHYSGPGTTVLWSWHWPKVLRQRTSTVSNHPLCSSPCVTAEYKTIFYKHKRDLWDLFGVSACQRQKPHERKGTKWDCDKTYSVFWSKLNFCAGYQRFPLCVLLLSSSDGN